MEKDNSLLAVCKLHGFKNVSEVAKLRNIHRTTLYDEWKRASKEWFFAMLERTYEVKMRRDSQ